MQRLLINLILICTLFPMVDLSGQPVPSDRILIVYLSRTHNTKTVAEMIHSKMGGDLVALELVEPYPENYRAIVDQVAEENRSGYLPPLKNELDIDAFDLVFIGFPTWGMQLPPPMKSFLHTFDLSGKTVVPFNTNGGYGLGSTVRTVHELCPDSNILEVFSVKGGSERDGVYLDIKGERKADVERQLVTWLKKIQLLED
ncbi:flavodoxin family protein [Flagellimonas sp.]|uniref:flavodoxin family protein n=1 Tax=Flagellimonas sp. TaxID=2058762 RepID=UPI003BAAF9EE